MKEYRNIFYNALCVALSKCLHFSSNVWLFTEKSANKITWDYSSSLQSASISLLTLQKQMFGIISDILPLLKGRFMILECPYYLLLNFITITACILFKTITFFKNLFEDHHSDSLRHEPCIQNILKT